MIDTHTHLYFPDFGNEITDIVQRCKESGVAHLILPNVDVESIKLMNDFHDRFPSFTSMAMGLHPTEVNENWEKDLEIIEAEIFSGKYIAIGEIGIDLYWDQSNFEFQKKAFERQLQIAEKQNLPVIIHSRSAFPETMQSIEKVSPTIPLVFHSFTGTTEDVERIRKGCEPYFGINGVVTYKNARELREAIPKIGLNKILLETDSPYLTPVPHRGKVNNSSYLPFIRDKISEILDIKPEEVEKTTDKNAKFIFKI